MDKNSCWEINLSEICYGLKNMLRADLGFWIMANIYPSRRWQSFSSLLFGSLLLTYVYAGGKQHWSLDFYSFPWNSSPWNSSPLLYFFYIFMNTNSLPWLWNRVWVFLLELSEPGNPWNHWEKKKKDEWLQELSFCSPSALHETILSYTFHSILSSITLNFPRLLHTTHRTPTLEHVSWCSANAPSQNYGDFTWFGFGFWLVGCFFFFNFLYQPHLNVTYYRQENQAVSVFHPAVPPVFSSLCLIFPTITRLG